MTPTGNTRARLLGHADRRLAGVAAAVGLALGACSGGGTVAPTVRDPAASSVTASMDGSPSPSSVPTGPPTVGLVELDHLEISLPGGPDFPVGLDGSVWILAPDGPLRAGGEGALVYRLDATTGDLQAEIPIGGRLCQGLNAGFGSVWACTDTGLARIDPASNTVVAEVAFDTAQVFTRPGIGADRVWALGGNVVADKVIEIDPETNAVVGTHPLDHAAATLTYGNGAVWVTAPADGLLLRLDAATGEVTVHAEGLRAPWTVAFGADSLWVGLYGEHGGERGAPGEPTVARVSAEDGSVRALIPINSPTTSEADIWASDEEVWIRSVGDPFLLRIDPSTDAVTFAVAGFHSGGALALLDGAIWTTSIEFHTAWRIQP